MKLKTHLYYFLRNNFIFKNWKKFFDEIWDNYPSSKEPIRRLLKHARENSPYYKNIIPLREDLDEWLSEAPILTKEILIKNFEQIKSSDYQQRSWYLNSTSGSTGKPVNFIQDKDYNEWLIASENYYYKKYLGFDYADTPKIIIWGSSRDSKKMSFLKAKLGNYLSNTSFLDPLEISAQNWDDYVNAINHKKPIFIRGFASILFLLANHIKEKKLKIHSPKYVATSAETLKPFMREVIEEVFNCPVYDYYGSREVGIIAAECSRGKMHTFPFFNYVEVVDIEGKPVRPGEEGNLLITNLRNYSMPIIRYEIGDTAILGDTCECGGSTPVLEKITGRITDHFITKEGSIVHGLYFARMFYFSKWVGEFQILQKDYEFLEIYYVPKDEPPEEEIENINFKIKEKMGENCRIDWIKTESVPRTSEGKWLFTRSELYRRGANISPATGIDV